MNRFDDEAASWDDADKLERTRRAAGLLRERLTLTGTERVLDLGAGTGQLSLHLADAVGEVLVTDASRGMVEVAQRNIEAAGLTRRFEALQLDLTTDTPPPTASFDGVWSMLALHHVPDLDVLLARVHDLLRPGGWLAVIDLDHDVDGAFHAHVGDDFEGHHGFDRDALRHSLERVGFAAVSFSNAGVVDKELDNPSAVHQHGQEQRQHGQGHHSDKPGQRSFPMFLMTATRS